MSSPFFILIICPALVLFLAWFSSYFALPTVLLCLANLFSSISHTFTFQWLFLFLSSHAQFSSYVLWVCVCVCFPRRCANAFLVQFRFLFTFAFVLPVYFFFRFLVFLLFNFLYTMFFATHIHTHTRQTLKRAIFLFYVWISISDICAHATFLFFYSLCRTFDRVKYGFCAWLTDIKKEEKKCQPEQL